jgi:hypothetical protein
MNWNKIKNKCPKAYDLFEKYFRAQGICDSDLPIENNLTFTERDMFDFFDKEGIYIDICVEGVDNFYSRIYLFPIFEWERDNKSDFKSRQLSEEWAFETAFKLLEKELR